jgi:hypothetical protein
MSTGPAPSSWSGRFASYQTIGYTVDSILKGSPAGTQVSVMHPLVNGSHTADTANIGLSSSLFSVGNRLIILASVTGQSVVDEDENLGAVPFSDSNEHTIKAML